MTAVTELRLIAAVSAAVAVVVVARSTLFDAPGRAGGEPAAWRTMRLPVPERARRALHQAAVEVDPATAFWAWIGVASGAVVTAPVLSTGPLVVVVCLAGPPIAVVALGGRRATLRRRQLPVALDTVASSLRSGHAVRHAVKALGDQDGPLSPEFAAVGVQAESGRPLAAVLAEWASGDDADTRLAGAALATAAELGGPAATALETTAQSLRDRAAANGLVDALSVQARLSAWLLTVAPIAFAGVMTGIDPDAGHFLFGTTIGWVCLIVGVGLDTVGGVWMHRMVRKTR